MTAEWPFRGRRLGHGAVYEELPCQETEHVACVFPNQVQFHLTFSFFQIQLRPLIIIANNVINRQLLSKSVVPKHSN
jgi:hypothetical protein